MRYNRIYSFAYLVCVLLVGTTMCTAMVEVAEQQQYKEFSDAEIEAFVVRGEVLAQKYTDSVFLEPLLDPQKAAHDRQAQWNKQLLGTFTLPLGSASLSTNIYYADVLYAAHAAAAWALEWGLYTVLNNAFVNAAVMQLEHGGDVQELFTRTRFVNKQCAALLLMYVVINHVLENTKETYLLSEWQAAPAAGSLLNLMPAMVLQIVGGSIEPHAVITTINALFKRFGLMPAWSEHVAIELIKEYGAQLLWLWWYQKNIIQPAFIEQMTNSAQAIQAVQQQLAQYAAVETLTLQQKQEINELRVVLTAMVSLSVMPSFSTWFGYKVTHLGFWLSISNLLLATPAWYKLGRFVYQTYQQLTPPKKQEEVTHE